MGLTISVGILEDLREADSEGYNNFRAYFDDINQALAAEHLPAHHEPDQLGPHDFVSLDMYGYSGLHYLRRLAARFNYEGKLPPPGGEDSSQDDVLARYCKESTEEAPKSRFARIFGTKSRPGSFDFNHLIQHSDCEGFYLPMDFTEVLFPDPALKIPGGMIGSSIRLRDECRRIATLMSLPDNIDPESDELFEATEQQGTGAGWKRYGVEAFTCIRLLRACEASVRSGAALVFI